MDNIDTSIAQQKLHELFEYRDGKLFWKIRKAACVYIGNEAGSIDKKGYRRVMINNKSYKTHRLVFMMHYGYLPKQVDHIDGNKLNNNIENLRQATHGQNRQNSKIQKNNTSGVKGINWQKRDNKWQARVMLNKKSHQIGYFETLEEAKKAIEKARQQLHGEFARHI